MASKGLGKGLGKGLDALFGEMPPIPKDPDNAPLMLAIQKVEPNPNQPRRDFDPVALQELADSIREHGVIQPLTVRALDKGFYQIIAGERRWRAARMAGLKQVPVYVMEADDRQVMELALIENLQRTDLNPMEEAQGYQTLISQYELTQEEVAQQVGRSRPAVANALRLLSLQDSIAKLVEEGQLSAGHARALLMIPGKKAQEEAAQKIITLQLSVRQAESMCRRIAEEKPKEEVPFQVDYVAECERTLGSALGRKVRIVTGKKKGRLELEYYGLDDLQALYEALQKLPPLKRKEEEA